MKLFVTFQALIKATKDHFGADCDFIGCRFHWKQAIRRKLLALDVPKTLITLLMDKNGLINILPIIPVSDIVVKGKKH